MISRRDLLKGLMGLAVLPFINAGIEQVKEDDMVLHGAETGRWQSQSTLDYRKKNNYEFVSYGGSIAIKPKDVNMPFDVKILAKKLAIAQGEIY